MLIIIYPFSVVSPVYKNAILKFRVEAESLEQQKRFH